MTHKNSCVLNLYVNICIVLEDIPTYITIQGYTDLVDKVVIGDLYA